MPLHARPDPLAGMRLVDHHCHGVVRRALDVDGFAALLTEGRVGPGEAETAFDSRVGFAVRRWCAPLLDLPQHTVVPEYVERRGELGVCEVNRRMLRAAGVTALCVDTGFTPEPLLTPAELGEAAGARAFEVVRLEAVAEEVAAGGCTAAGFAGAVRAELERRRGAGAVAWKSVAAYRGGLALPAARPTDGEVAAAVGRWLGGVEDGGRLRLSDPVLHAFLVWTGLELKLPVQVHTGFGDADLHLGRADPVLLTDLLRAVRPLGVPVVLLHCYPFHRQAAHLAQVMPHVYLDLSLATAAAGDRAAAVFAETLELAPFRRVLYASDGYGLPELHFLGAHFFRRALSVVLRDGIAEEWLTAPEAARVARLVGVDNARRLYGLPGVDGPTDLDD